jgi:hypothetical protein
MCDSRSLGILKGSPYTSSATDACRSALKNVRIPRRTRGSVCFQCWSVWRMMAFLESGGSVPRVHWLQYDRRFSGKVQFHTIWPWSGRILIQTVVPGGDDRQATETGYPVGQKGACHGFGCDSGMGMLLASVWSGRLQSGSMCSLVTLEEVLRGICVCVKKTGWR